VDTSATVRWWVGGGGAGESVIQGEEGVACEEFEKVPTPVRGVGGLRGDVMVCGLGDCRQTERTLCIITLSTPVLINKTVKNREPLSTWLIFGKLGQL